MNEERMLNIILAPYISEKTSVLGDKNNQYAFKVMPNANKVEVKQAIEKLFNVVVDKVRIMNVKPKTRRTRNGVGKISGWKKAYICLAKGHDIDFTKVQTG